MMKIPWRFLLAVLPVFTATFVAVGQDNKIPPMEPAPGTEVVYPADGANMVYVPSGEFTMGIDSKEAETIGKDLGYKPDEELWAYEAYPKHKINLPGYFIDKYECTVKRWQAYVKATGYSKTRQETTQHFDKPDEQRLPAAEIFWEEAKEYCKWAGKALPTEAQWEKAARGTDGRLYPWGSEAPTPEHGHFGIKGKMPPLYTTVGRYPKGVSPYGAMDMLGNQYEWTCEWMEPYPDNPMDGKMKENQAKYNIPKSVVLRGGSWYHGWVGFYAAKRFGFKPDETYYHVSFRTVWVPPAGYFQSPEFEKAKEAAKIRRDRKEDEF
jgi:formylglycine-generating enzyme required for sulfatase activity